VQPFCQFGLSFAFQGWPTFFVRNGRRGWIIQTGIQAQARDDTNARQAADFQQEIQHRVGPIGHHHQMVLWHPARYLQDHLPSPIRDGFVSHVAFLVVAFRRSQHGQKGQGPDPARPRNGSQEHQGDPAQAIGFHKELLTRTHRIAIDPSRGNLAASPTFDRFIDAHDQWRVSWEK
jgi:hypothetical protein